MNDARCAEHVGVEFFPVLGQLSRPAKAVCSTCLVSSDCLPYALRHEIVQGVWGGLNGRERRALRTTTEQHRPSGRSTTSG
jgi:WhiB family redox-sensing transcriptional regulator